MAEPSNKIQRREKEKLSKQQYHLPQHVPEELELPMDQAKEEDVIIEEEHSKLRKQSRRIPRVSARNLESIKAELQDSDTE